METRRDFTVSFFRANLYGMLTPLPAVAALTWLYTRVWGAGWIERASRQMWGWFDALSQIGRAWAGRQAAFSWAPLGAGILAIAAILLGAVLHEVVHAVSWAWLGRQPLSAVRFGLNWKTLTPYAHCRRPVHITAYRWGTALPGLLVGLLPCLVALCSGQDVLFIWGLVFVFGAGGDWLILWLIRRVERTAMVEDHPSRVGCIVITSPPEH